MNSERRSAQRNQTTRGVGCQESDAGLQPRRFCAIFSPGWLHSWLHFGAKIVPFLMAKSGSMLVSGLVSDAAKSPQPTQTAPQQKTAVEIYKMAGPSVVLVETYGDDGKVSGSGTGFIVSADGRILTCFHVIAHTKRATVRLANEEAYDKVHVLAVDKRRDIALLLVDGMNLPYLRLGRWSKARSGNRPASLVIWPPEKSH